MKKILISSSTALLIAFASLQTAQAAKCCRTTIEGCGKTANVCIAKECSNALYTEARKKFEAAYKCPSAKMKSSIGTCSGQKCDIDLR